MQQGLYVVLDVNEHIAVLAGPHTNLVTVPRSMLPADVGRDALIRLYAVGIQPTLPGGHEAPPPSVSDEASADQMLRWLDEDEQS
jgi:hypothetical protein